MKTKNLFALILPLLGMLASCNPFPYKGEIHSYLALYNVTTDTISVEYHQGGDDTVTILVPPDSMRHGGVRLGFYKGSKEDDQAPASVIEEALSHVTITQLMPDGVRELNRQWYDEADDFLLHRKYDLGLLYVTYELTVNDDMFSTDNIQSNTPLSTPLTGLK